MSHVPRTQPCASADGSPVTHAVCAGHVKPSVHPIGAQPCTSAPALAGVSQRVPSTHAKPSLHGIGSHAPSAAQRIPSPQSIALAHGGAHKPVPVGMLDARQQLWSVSNPPR